MAQRLWSGLCLLGAWRTVVVMVVAAVASQRKRGGRPRTESPMTSTGLRLRCLRRCLLQASSTGQHIGPLSGLATCGWACSARCRPRSCTLCVISGVWRAGHSADQQAKPIIDDTAAQEQPHPAHVVQAGWSRRPVAQAPTDALESPATTNLPNEVLRLLSFT